MIETRPKSENTIRVLIVDDHAIVRQGLRTFLELQDGGPLPIQVVGEAINGRDAVELANRLQPDIILLDTEYRRQKKELTAVGCRWSAVIHKESGNKPRALTELDNDGVIL